MSKKPLATDAPLAKAPVNSATVEDTVFFESTVEEPIQYDICGIRAHRDPSGLKCRWRVPATMADRFARHAHVLSGRVIPILAPDTSAPATE